MDDLDWREVLRHGAGDFVVLTPAYPWHHRHGGEFIRNRVEGYRAAGLRGVVVDYSSGPGSAPRVIDDGRIVSFPIDRTAELITELAPLDVPVLAHSPSPALSGELLRLPGERVTVWYHGYEVRDYRRLHCNFTPEELMLRGRQLDGLNRTRFEAAAPLFADPDIGVVFVSNFQRRISEYDVGVVARNHHVIPNHIDTDLFRARLRREEEATDLLLLRSFAQRNYGNDIAIAALDILSRRAGFGELRITVRGFGANFASEVAPLRGLGNVDIQEAYSGPAEMAALHYDHGVFLCPTRFDSQGVVLGEAMASGMVTVTNAVAAIPEFTDARSSLLARPDDPLAFAEAIWHLVEHPELMPVLSANAPARVEEQCGISATIEREIELIRRHR